MAATDLADRKKFAAHAFEVTSHYDTAIFNYFNQEAQLPVFKQSLRQSQENCAMEKTRISLAIFMATWKQCLIS